MENSKLEIKCSWCSKPWIAGLRELTEAEKAEWVCPDCLNERTQIEKDQDKLDLLSEMALRQ